MYQNILNKDQPIITNNYKDEIVILKETINELKADLLRENFKLFSMVMKNKDKLNELSKNFEDKKKSLN